MTIWARRCVVKSKTIRYQTPDEPPRLGEWIRSTRRPRYAYLVVGVHDAGPVRVGGRVALGGARTWVLLVERRQPSAPGADDVVHPIYWNSRRKVRR